MCVQNLKVLLVDDEENVKNLLKLCIDWDNLNLEIVGDASSGIEALTLIEECHPDIVLTDIEMPYMNGLALSKQILETYTDIQVVIITAHDQFSYAKEAINIGVHNFILKPIDPVIITDTLNKLALEIRNRRKKLTELEVSYTYVQNNIFSLRNKCLNELIQGDLTNLELLKDLQARNSIYPELSEHLQLALIAVLFPISKYSASQKSAILKNCMHYIEEQYTPLYKLYVFLDNQQQIAILCNSATVYLPELTEHIVAYLEANLNTVVHCGISTTTAHLEALKQCYEDAQTSLKLCHILGESIVYNHPFMQTGITYDFSKEDTLHQLVLLIQSGSAEQAIKNMQNLLHSHLAQNLSDVTYIKYKIINTLEEIVKTLTQNGIPPSSLSFIETSYKKIIDMERYKDMENYTLHLINELCALTYGINGHKLNDIVLQIIHYLELHYSDETITLTNIAQLFHINSSYLSRTFKKVTNKSFSEYLVEIRIKKAMELLQYSNYKAYQLAQEVGIPDPNYFTKCFKKVATISFQDYKTSSRC
ncbi:DNA-binding response regulator [Sporanaerobium hydrogeniformans]|uniref:DNA-binding response regulator n=1 Tax=Sporanaerobium hydrogeniformans TaxID=3072179 RepID=A0AC61D6M0_9FIRM|nr:response regulator [Sporanaerobium hydrogeniformans]PHV69346.1 DNA-binding response regulator [Sporanaerobium hydrogeniformans]